MRSALSLGACTRRSGLQDVHRWSATCGDTYVFGRLHRPHADSWQMTINDYGATKYDETLKLLLDRTFRRVLETGYLIGILTRALADHCDGHQFNRCRGDGPTLCREAWCVRHAGEGSAELAVEALRLDLCCPKAAIPSPLSN